MKKGITLLYFNEKGGVGKTTLSALSSYVFNEEHKSTLLIDFDPQHNLTDVISKTFNNGKKYVPLASLYNGLSNEDLTRCVCRASKYIDIMPSNISLMNWQYKTDKIKLPDRFDILNNLLEPFKQQYDYIIVDVPPTFNAFSMNAIFASDCISLVLQTERSSYTSALDTVKELGDLQEKYHIKFHFLGAILYLMIRASTTKKIKKAAEKTFSGFLFKNVIRYHERVNRFTDSGIRDKDFWDVRAITMYENLTHEVENRINEALKQ